MGRCRPGSAGGFARAPEAPLRIGERPRRANVQPRLDRCACNGRRGERSLTAVSVMSGGVRAGAAEMPRLEAFDQEFGPEPATILPEPRRRMGLRFWAWLVVMVAAGSVGALALLWPTSDAGSLLQGQSTPTAPRTASRGGGDEQVDRLMREVASLRRQVRDLTSAHRRPPRPLPPRRQRRIWRRSISGSCASRNGAWASRPGLRPCVQDPTIFANVKPGPAHRCRWSLRNRTRDPDRGMAIKTT